LWGTALMMSNPARTETHVTGSSPRPG
jgi:hypothetical protein